VLRLGRDSGGFFYPVRLVYPFDGPAAADELGRVAAAGAAWLKLHPNVQRFDVAAPVVTELVRNAARRELPVLFDAYSPWDANQPARFAGLATAVPEASIILAHGPGFPQLLFYEILARNLGWRRDVWIDMSLARCCPAARSPRSSSGCCAGSASTGSSSAATTRSTSPGRCADKGPPNGETG